MSTRYTDIELEDDLSTMIDFIEGDTRATERDEIIAVHDRIVAGFAEATGRTDGSEHDPRAVLDECMRRIAELEAELKRLKHE